MESITKYIKFTLREQFFGVHIEQVISIEKLQEITDVPKTPDFIKGIMQLRGQTIPVIDLKERLHMERTEPTEQNRILIVGVDDVQVGLLVDSATEVIDIDPTKIEPAPNMIRGVNNAFISGIAKLEKELLILLDLETVLNKNETNEVRDFINQ